MYRKLVGIAIGSLIACATPAFAQRGPGGPPPGNRSASEEMKKLQAEIEKLQAEIKEAEAQLHKAQSRKEDQRPESPMGGSGRPNPKSGGRGGFGLPGGFGPPGAGGFGPGGAFGPGSFGGFRFGNDVKSLQAQLDQLHEAAKMIAERTKDVEARLKQAKEEEARAQKSASTSTGGKSDVDKRLDRIEQALEEIRQELKRRK